MPYIKQEDRKRFEKILSEVNEVVHTMNEGDLNYLLTSISHQYITAKGTTYSVLNQVVGVFECAKLEFYRRKAASYEDFKISQNGDV